MTDELVVETTLRSGELSDLPDAQLRAFASIDTGTYAARLWIPDRTGTAVRCVSFCQGAILVELDEDGRFLALTLQDVPGARDDDGPFRNFIKATGETDLYWAAFIHARRAWNECARLVARERRELARARKSDPWNAPAETERVFANCGRG